MGNSAFQTLHPSRSGFSPSHHQPVLPMATQSVPCFAQANFLGDLLSLLLLSVPLRTSNPSTKYCQLHLQEQMKNRATSITLTWSFLTWILAVASYMDFLPSLCSPPTCSHHSSAFLEKPSRVPISEELRVLRGACRALHTCHSSISPWCPGLISRSLPGSSQSSHARLLAALLTHQALFSHSPGLCWTCNAPATAELAASLPAGVLIIIFREAFPDLIGWSRPQPHQSLPLLFPSISLHNIYHHVTSNMSYICCLTSTLYSNTLKLCSFNAPKPETIPIGAHWSFTEALRREKEKKKWSNIH